MAQLEIGKDLAAEVNVLDKLGMRYERMVKLADDDPDVKLFAWDV